MARSPLPLPPAKQVPAHLVVVTVVTAVAVTAEVGVGAAAAAEAEEEEAASIGAIRRHLLGLALRPALHVHVRGLILGLLLGMGEIITDTTAAMEGAFLGWCRSFTTPPGLVTTPINSRLVCAIRCSLTVMLFMSRSLNSSLSLIGQRIPEQSYTC